MTTVDSDHMNDSLIEVRATVHLTGLNVGQHALVDPDDPYIKECLDAELLVPAATTRTGRE